jgi:chemotaxis protein CheD
MTTASETLVTVGLGELKTSRDPQVTLACLGLGSCIGIAAYDAAARVAGMAHVVLPERREHQAPASAKYATDAVPLLVEALESLGAARGRIQVRLAGGARMTAGGAGLIFNIGEQNFVATVDALRKAGVHIAATDTGGSRGRTLRLDVASGKATVSLAGEPAREF